jgi:hypothetical protein
MSTQSKANRKGNPLKTKNDRQRINVLSDKQLAIALEKATRGRDKSKIRSRIAFKLKHSQQP